LDLASVDLVQHLVSTAWIKIEGDVAQPGIAVAANQCAESSQLLSDGVFASGKQVDRQIAADLAECDRIVQPRRGAEEGNKRVGVKVFKTEGSAMNASTIARSRHSQSKGVRAGSNAALRRLLLLAQKRCPGQPIQQSRS